ncbi:MAG: hypothetical protein J0M18_19745, partial [Ignavibacteria bacterium]|nr:hypothetical protein [Ignavibacteria bacterium]
SEDSISDFAIFDSNLLIAWSVDIEKDKKGKESGTLIMSWNDNVQRFANQISDRPIDNYNNCLFPNFQDLIDNLESNEEIQKINQEIKEKRNQNYEWVNNYKLTI